ncbi:hypothetical protein Tco_1259688 [Tanacetum coccineum]
MLCYLTRMETYYIKCIKDGPFHLKIAKGAIKPEIQWTLNERMVVIQDQRLKSIIMSCIPDDIIESVISCKTAKAKWADLVHSFKGLIALADDELAIRKNHTRNGEWINITMRKVNILLSMDEDSN